MARPIYEVKHNLTKEQRKLLVTWAAEGLQLWEINERADREDPPFEIRELQLKHVRRQAKKRYSKLKEEFERDAFNEGLARRPVRVRELMDRHALLKQVISARAKKMADEIEGGETGLFVRDYKGKDADRAVYKVDIALLKELRDIERQIAIELSQWAERKEISGPDGAAIPISITDLINKVYGSGTDPSGE